MEIVTNPSTVDTGEIARFEALAAEWWDPRGRFRPLHIMNPTRVRFIRDRLLAHFGREPREALAGLRILDIGCGGGLVTEPMARLGATIIGVDAGRDNVEAARRHADEMKLPIDYRVGTAEEIQAAGEAFDVVLALEIVEHVADVDLFLGICAGLVRPGGLLVLSTLNRTVKSLILAKIAAEYVLRWIEPGTHDWNRFLSPGEVGAYLERHGLRVGEVSGMTYSLLTDEWLLSRDTEVNYLLTATKEAPLPAV